MDAKLNSEESSANPGNLDTEGTVHPKARVAVARDDKGTHGTTMYLNTMEIDMVNIDKDDKKIWWKIYEAIDEPYFVKVKEFL